ncbi:protein sel-1 homolog 3 [Erpetoichthys calabaricus]|uniref:SEL1L family member 3 n=1 Tax=Erpetoichthys calabaricus TaxID=27687 RepID=A0A8C4RP67_ERPCA|nr:protein sel-1 homolog 3 [Erpetoichthys calabaricus]XP_051783600.1 protein sel-1 homolog 3 [Erpetoichthys calabaricus]
MDASKSPPSVAEGARRLFNPKCLIHCIAVLSLVPYPVFCISSVHTTHVTERRDQNFNKEDFIQFENSPENVIDNYNLTVKYLCSQPCVIGVEVIASSELRTGKYIYVRLWQNEKHLSLRRSLEVMLKFPRIIIYRADFFNRHSIIAHNVMLRAWIVRKHTFNHSSSYRAAYENAVARTYSILNTLPPFQRPSGEQKGCLGWYTEWQWRLKENKIPQCLSETGTVEILKFPHASTGQKYGIIKKFYPFINRDLEKIRVQAVHAPRFTYSIWIYLLNECKQKLCGIVHFINLNNLYDTPMLSVNESGDLIVQVHHASGNDGAFKSSPRLSLRIWYRLDLSFDGTKATLTVSSWKNMKETTDHIFIYQFQENIHFNDTSGYLVLGGSKYMQSIEGFFGPTKYYRLNSKPSSMNFETVASGSLMERIDLYYQERERVKASTLTFLNVLKESRFLNDQRTCDSSYYFLKNKYGELLRCDKLLWTWEIQTKYKEALDLLVIIENDLYSGPWNSDIIKEFGKKLHEMADKKLKSPGGLKLVNTLIQSLKVSSFCGCHDASYYLSVIYETGLGVPTDFQQGHLYGLVGAQGDDKLSLLHLGYKHIFGFDGYPQDYDLSYSYYSNIGHQTALDKWTVEKTQAYVETIRLTDDIALKEQTNENEDKFQYLNYQAQRGDLGAQHTLARMLFWGQSGVTKNATAAAQWYARSALEIEDPQSMYDFSIVLFKGQGVKKNITFAYKLMKKAASKGLSQAVNGLGWYYHAFKNDTVTAAKYFEKAAKNGNKDAWYNLGLFHQSGQYPGHPEKNETAAFQHFLIAASAGQVDAAIECSFFYATGKLSSAKRDSQLAIQLTKQISEDNGYLGFITRQALNSYLEGSWSESLLNYLLIAEAGIEVAQFNVAYLCEQMPDLMNITSGDCEWRYYNFSVAQFLPSTLAFLKMGDFYYYGHKNQTKDIHLSMAMYINAALRRDPQGYFNLAQLLEEGHHIPPKALKYLNIEKGQSNISLILKLYERCMNYEPEEMLSPCSMSFLRVQLQIVWKRILNNHLHIPLVYIIGTVSLVSFITILVQHFSYEPPTQLQRERNNQRDGESQEDNSSAPHVHMPDYRIYWFHLLKQRCIQHANSVNQWLRHHQVAEWSCTLLGVCLSGMYILAIMYLL